MLCHGVVNIYLLKSLDIYIPSISFVSLLQYTLFHFQVTVDVAWSPAGVDGRYYDYGNIGLFVDFLFVMAYDEQSQIRGPCIAGANSPLYNAVKGKPIKSLSCEFINRNKPIKSLFCL